MAIRPTFIGCQLNTYRLQIAKGQSEASGSGRGSAASARTAGIPRIGDATVQEATDVAATPQGAGAA